MRIGIDLMGSDSSPDVLFQAVLEASQQLEKTTFIALATQPVIDSILTTPNILEKLNSNHSKIEFHPVTEIIEMNDEPLIAIRQKKNSSLVVGLKLLKKRLLDALVTAGNTGALIAGATLSLPLLPGIKRPALLATLPTEKGYVAVIDVGGNVSAKANHLVQFAQMGAAYQRCSQGIALPKVGLLNIGGESKKGHSVVREAYQVLQDRMILHGTEKQKMEFVGNTEGREVFQGKVDVLVTDGFTGNVLLKASEGASYFILEHLKFALQDIPTVQKEAVFKYLKYHFDYEEYAGAIVCGIDCVAVKCHGKSSTRAILNGILGASELVRNGFINQIKQQLLLA
ncbi:MAG: phosphate acyltransferase PlsX [Parachlamydiaceae bacterium]|nr:phosphate acyltransferase PlsX [Parachlamydiaceae bacterium]